MGRFVYKIANNTKNTTKLSHISELVASVKDDKVSNIIQKNKWQ
ncbi:hypothetical protein [Arcicella rigui]|uniref:Uncharacterized protein n=1 Tax=Arcicella rigui TaxID=797020 RepID=A0ABU5QCL0_9BACT|nr:hypothetical protein [Arcicella rigui]MEA5140586.1 hypothetical protein [Arcicella rigui]